MVWVVGGGGFCGKWWVPMNSLQSLSTNFCVTSNYDVQTITCDVMKVKVFLKI